MNERSFIVKCPFGREQELAILARSLPGAPVSFADNSPAPKAFGAGAVASTSNRVPYQGRKEQGARFGAHKYCAVLPSLMGLSSFCHRNPASKRWASVRRKSRQTHYPAARAPVSDWALRGSASTVYRTMRPARTNHGGFQMEVLQQFPPNRRYLIGVSGGRDSAVLLHQLVDLGYRRLVVCHLDHQLRGRASGADARFVERLAAKLHGEFEIGRTNVAELARTSKQSVETAGRMARYEFFARVARRRRCHIIFLGHHADDLVETFLMNLFRGAGPAGFGGIREITSRRVSGTELQIVRPLLAVWRAEIDAYV